MNKYNKINLDKCGVISFCRIKEPIRYSYSISNVMLRTVTKIKDLGITFSSNITFNRRISTIINKTVIRARFSTSAAIGPLIICRSPALCPYLFLS